MSIYSTKIPNERDTTSQVNANSKDRLLYLFSLYLAKYTHVITLEQLQGIEKGSAAARPEGNPHMVNDEYSCISSAILQH
jgi:hypothetical protein